ncbi:hypothetical protein Tco_1095023 [Tanacetum coccineum]
MFPKPILIPVGDLIGGLYWGEMLPKPALIPVLDFSIGFGFFAIPKDVAPTAPVLHRSSKVSQQPERYGNLIDTKGHDLGDHNEPTTYQEAINDSESKKSLEAMRAWMQYMKDNEL